MDYDVLIDWALAIESVYFFYFGKVYPALFYQDQGDTFAFPPSSFLFRSVKFQGALCYADESCNFPVEYCSFSMITIFSSLTVACSAPLCSYFFFPPLAIFFGIQNSAIFSSPPLSKSECGCLSIYPELHKEIRNCWRFVIESPLAFCSTKLS